MDRIASLSGGLIPKSEFIGLENMVHLAAGGETPMLKSHRHAVERFMADKALAETSRVRMDETVMRCKEKAARLLNASAEDISLISSSSEGINILLHGLRWEPGDNVVTCDVEFPSEVLPWTRLREKSVEIRIVPNREWYVSLEDIESAIDDRTRVVAISEVSYFTGQRISIRELSKIVHNRGALLCVDSTHAAGVVSIDATHADVLVASCYKWLLGTHGVAILYWNRHRLADVDPPFLGWHSGVSIPDWRDPINFTLRADGGRFVPGNYCFIGVYILDNALTHILRIGTDAIEKHVLKLSGKTLEGLQHLGFEVMTPNNIAERAGNICFMTEHIDAVVNYLADRNIRVWGGYAGVGRVRVSAHLYNTEDDVEKLIRALGEIPSYLRS